ncbi:MAG TPA: 3-keto-5-aminohexanoate cleavage protein [Pseudonocardia sp.]|nr:3-keto-5-aminohexanoate cleavage protein [Pseudonocardia sp.]
MSTGIKRIKVCLNGRRSRQEHPAVPLAPRDVAAAAAAAVEAGAEAVHVHVRGADGAETLVAEDIGAAVRAVRETCPSTPVGVSTGLWITDGDTVAREAILSDWLGLSDAARPDFASVNVFEPGWAKVRDQMIDAGIAVEAGLFTVADAEALAADAGNRDWLRVLVEIVDVPPERAVIEADRILRRLDELEVAAPRLVHGFNTTCWPLIAHAGALGLPTRIGLEDITAAPEGGPVRDNADLVRHALRMWDDSARQ